MSLTSSFNNSSARTGSRSNLPLANRAPIGSRPPFHRLEISGGSLAEPEGYFSYEPSKSVGDEGIDERGVCYG